VDSHRERESYIADLRSKLADLDKNLQVLEQRASHATADTRQYLLYAGQFDRLRQRTVAIAETVKRDTVDATVASVEWAELKTRLDREWRDLLTDLDGIENYFGPKARS
jgi:hypothetical protein